MFAWNLCHGTLSTPEQSEIIPLLSLVLTLNIWHLVLVFLLLTLNMYLFSGFDLLIFQFVFRLRWIQVPFIYRKDFFKVKYLHEVACTAPCLIFFQSLFKICKLECVKSTFFEWHLKLLRGNFPGQKFVVTSGRNFIGGQLSGGSCSGRNYSEKNVRGAKIQG